MLLALNLFDYFEHEQIVVHKLEASFVILVPDEHICSLSVQLEENFKIGASRSKVISCILAIAALHVQIYFVIMLHGGILGVVVGHQSLNELLREKDIAKSDCQQEWCVLLIAYQIHVHSVKQERVQDSQALFVVVEILMGIIVILPCSVFLFCSGYFGRVLSSEVLNILLDSFVLHLLLGLALLVLSVCDWSIIV